MNITWKTIIWQQFGAAIDMLGNALRACPDELWRDLYLTGAEEGFAPPAPFTLIEMEEDDLPDRPYTKDELQAYLAYSRRKCQATIEALTDETAQRRCRFGWGDVSFVELRFKGVTPRSLRRPKGTRREALHSLEPLSSLISHLTFLSWYLYVASYCGILLAQVFAPCPLSIALWPFRQTIHCRVKSAWWKNVLRKRRAKTKSDTFLALLPSR